MKHTVEYAPDFKVSVGRYAGPPKCDNCKSDSSVRYQSRLDIANNRKPVRYFCFECYEKESSIVRALEVKNDGEVISEIVQ